MTEHSATKYFASEIAASHWARWMQQKYGQVRTTEQHNLDGSVEMTVYYDPDSAGKHE